ncbi:hypothetical protein KZX37_07210 [Microbacterium sp. EYE_5]|uniref:sunset domain-containing protein n=1 Tax=unclassified Microbacterium TaxID=2609290 RepID=UPI0020062A2C|nr:MULTISPECIES: hypothetical protein [unclassified Microbacterium]MCK6081701.1 hypothetical protein [Microbacterium sp. EYE_382]MCK6086971.1 hypothetical protein [Microbacterium sp. EYE_384]MCK6123531.1 hypothetical protein [Microbacterium sp. EYE_80]MCK6126440.1 hypothetical protein [Microbacterium sp. EYE_79]MCK6142655.1 hypothetical protein [Microbacterium sp. EYE_39]
MGASLRRRSAALAAGAALLASTVWALPQAAVAAEAAPTGSITGTVAGDQIDTGGVVTAWLQTGPESFDTYSSPIYPDGTYVIENLPAGAYRVGFNELGYDDGESITSWTEWWNDALTLDDGTDVIVGDGIVSGIDADVDSVGGAASDPVVSGAAVVGQRLTVSPGVWPTGTELAYAWYAGEGLYQYGSDAWVDLGPDALGKRISVDVLGALDATGYRSDEALQFKRSTETATVKAAALQSATPSISGPVTATGTLTAKPGTWTKGATLSYEWYASGKKISGATKSSYTLPASVVGKTITVKVTGKKAGFLTASKTSKATLKVALSATPAISGTAQAGKKLTAKPGRWTAGSRFSYQWYASGKAISGATKASYTLPASLVGKAITVKVTGKKAAYATASRTSKATLKVALAATPTIAGTAQVGKKLTAKPGRWTVGSRFSYQWYANGKAVAGATKATLTLTKGVKGKKIAVKVTGKKAGHPTIATMSKSTASVKAAPKPPTKAPSAEPQGWSCPDSHPIKGNQGAEDWIYHVPGSTYYSRTKPEECFATVAAAERAGYRAPKR